jgi:hypothetical protein
MIHHENFPTDGIPYWDFNAPDIPDAPRDASAAAIMASALFELCRYSEEYSDTFLRVAINQINVLSTDQYRALPGTNNNFILMHCTGNYPGNSEVDTPINYADYYYIESLTRYRRHLNHSPVGDFTFDESSTPLKIAFDASPTNDPDNDSVTYRWDFNDGKKGYSLTPSISHTFPGPGTYLVTLIASDKWGGIDSVQHSIDVTTVTGISQANDGNICVYPNPASDGFNVELPGDSLPAFLSMVDMCGQQRLIGIDIMKTRIETDDWRKGIYILLIKTPHGIHKERMIIN